MVAEQQSKAIFASEHLDATKLSVTSTQSELSSNLDYNVFETETKSDNNVLPANVSNSVEDSNSEAQEPTEYESINPQYFSNSL